MKTLIAALLTLTTTVVFAATPSQKLGVLEFHEISFWHTNLVPKAVMDQVLKTKPEAGVVEITDKKLKQKILNAYSLDENVEVVSLVDGKKSKHKTTKINLVRDSGECLYKYKNYFTAEIHPTIAEKQTESASSIALPKTMKVIPLPKDLISKIASYFSADPEVEQSKQLNLVAEKPFVLGLKEKSQEYFVTIYPAPDMGATYIVFQIKNGKAVKVDEIDFPACGS